MNNGFDKGITLARLEPLKGSPRAATRIALGVAVVLGILLSGNAYAYAPIKAQIQIKQMTFFNFYVEVKARFLVAPRFNIPFHCCLE